MCTACWRWAGLVVFCSGCWHTWHVRCKSWGTCTAGWRWSVLLRLSQRLLLNKQAAAAGFVLCHEPCGAPCCARKDAAGWAV